MSTYIPSIDPMAGLHAAEMLQSYSMDRQTAAKEFSSVFLQQLLSQAFKAQGADLWGSSDMFPSYPELFTSQIIKQLAADDAFGFNELINETVAKRMSDVQNAEGMY